MKNNSTTHQEISRKFDDYEETHPSRPPEGRAYSAGAETALLMVTSKPVAVLVGFGVGLSLLILAGIAFYSAAQWAAFARDGAQVGYNLVGVFLTIAGVGALLATYNHNFRLPNQGAPAHH